MAFNGKVYMCNKGNMPLSDRIKNILIERYSSGCFPRKPDVGIQNGDFWYCPGCGIPLNKEYSCDLCSNTISDFNYELVEFNPHN